MPIIVSSVNAEKMEKEHMPGDFKIPLGYYIFGAESEPVDCELNVIQENNLPGAELRARVLEIPGVKEIRTYDVTGAEFTLPS